MIFRLPRTGRTQFSEHLGTVIIMWTELFLLLLTVLAAWLIKVYRAQWHWEKMGIMVPGYSFPWGNHAFFTFRGLRKIHCHEASRTQYMAVKERCRFYGGYSFAQRFLVIVDPELAKDVMVKNFHCFVDRSARNSESFLIHTGTLEDEVNLRQFIANKGEAWKEQRATFSPIFTSGKLKGMFGLVLDTSERLMRSLDRYAEDGKGFEAKDLFGKYSMDTTASCAFGVDARSFDESDQSDFVRYANMTFRFSHMEIVKFMFLVLIPFARWLSIQLKITVAKAKEIRFFYNVIKSTMEHRIKTNIKRNDFVDLMLDAMKKEGPSTEDDQEDSTQMDRDAKLHPFRHGGKKPLDELTAVASAFNILTAGYDTTSQALAHLTYQLAINPDIQDRLQSELDDAMSDEDEDALPTYETLSKLEYLEMAIMETVRMYPALALIQRGCTADYKIPDTDIWIRKGDEIFVNVCGMHYDPDLYPEPTKFNPDHFSREAKENRHPYTFHGFGQGPRNCIGMRFALMEAKIAMARILRKYTIVRCAETPSTLTLDPASILGACKEELVVKLEGRKSRN